MQSVTIILDKYSDWFPPLSEDEDIEDAATFIKETLSLYGYCEAHRKIINYRRARTRAAEQNKQPEKQVTP